MACIPKKWEKSGRVRYKRIGASECLERERGPGGPQSEMKWSAFALAK